MKKIITLATLALLMAAGASAQTMYDAANIANKDLNGTARFVGMGGAMGALGGDISTIGTNPAGIGIYRSNDIMTSFGFSSFGTESSFAGNKFNSDKTQGSFDNIGIVFASKIGNETPLRYVNFGFNYKKAKSFYRNMAMSGALGNNSQTYQMAAMSDGIERFGTNPFSNPELGWLSVLGFDSWLIDQSENLMYKSIAYRPDAAFRSEERGGVDQYDFNLSFNINDRIYLGLTVGAYAVNYSKYVYYQEEFTNNVGKLNGERYDLQSWNKIKGSGFDLKFGAIFRPFESSPLRIGLAVHTPTFYSMEYVTSAIINSDVWLLPNGSDKEVLVNTKIDTYNELGKKDMVRDFNLSTPWTYNVSLGYTIGKSLALGAEYEYQDYSSMMFRYADNGEAMLSENKTVKDMMKGMHTVRLGAEYKVIPEFAIRAGYNYSTAAYTDGAYKWLPSNSINTDTDFANAKSLSNYTLGLGYRGSIFYADVAYKYSTYKSDFYAFDSANLTKTDVTNTRSQVLFTLGVRF